MSMMVTNEVDRREVDKIIRKAFMTRKEFKTLVGISSNTGDAMFNSFRNKIKKELEAEGLCLPDTKHLPTNLILQYLSLFGIDYKKPK